MIRRSEVLSRPSASPATWFRNIGLDAAAAPRPGARRLPAILNIGLPKTAALNPETYAVSEYRREGEISSVVTYNIQPQVELRVN